MTTFLELYKAETEKPTPRQAFVARVSKAAGVPLQTAKAWCIGKRLPRQAARMRIAAALGMDTDELFPDKEHRTRRTK